MENLTGGLVSDERRESGRIVVVVVGVPRSSKPSLTAMTMHRALAAKLNRKAQSGGEKKGVAGA